MHTLHMKWNGTMLPNLLVRTIQHSTCTVTIQKKKAAILKQNSKTHCKISSGAVWVADLKHHIGKIKTDSESTAPIQSGMTIARWALVPKKFPLWLCGRLICTVV